MDDLQKMLQDVARYLASQAEVAAAYVFGSVAKGTVRQNSDVDVAVLFAAGLSREKRFELRLELAGELEDIVRRPVDLIDMQEAPLFLQHQVRRFGRLIVDKDRNGRIAYEVKSRREYFDFQYILDRRNNAMIAKLGGKLHGK